MFQFPRLPSSAYVFSARDDTALPVPGFPIRVSAGQSPVQQLTAAYRSRPRPSSTPDAKASTVYLTILTVIVDSAGTEAPTLQR